SPRTTDSPESAWARTEPWPPDRTTGAAPRPRSDSPEPVARYHPRESPSTNRRATPCAHSRRAGWTRARIRFRPTCGSRSPDRTRSRIAVRTRRWPSPPESVPARVRRSRRRRRKRSRARAARRSALEHLPHVRPCHRVGVDECVARVTGCAAARVERRRDGAWDIAERDAALEEQRDGLLVGGVEHRGR